MEGGGGGTPLRTKKKELLLSSPSSSSSSSSSSNFTRYFFSAQTVTDEKKKRQRDASKRALARLVPPKPTRDDSVNVRETSNTTKRPFGFAIFFLELCSTRKHTRERDAIAHPIEHRRATRHRRQEKKQIFFADISTNARDRVSRES